MSPSSITFGKATIRKNIYSAKKINDNTYCFIMKNKTAYLVEGITDITINHENGNINNLKSLINWKESYIDDQNNIIIVLKIFECYDYPFYQRVYNYMYKRLQGF